MVKVHFSTQGCSSNVRESEIMMGLLKNSGYEISENEKDSEVKVVNICTVKGDFTALREISRFRRKNPDKKLIVAGCITDSIIPKIKNLDCEISMVNTHNLGKINAVVENSLNGAQLELLDKKYEIKVDLPSVRKNPAIGIVPILNGCNYFCTFCSTKLIKGKLFSYPMDSIRNDVKEHLKSGCKEIWITSNDTGAYMVDQGGKQKLVELMGQILTIPMDFKVRIGMMNPGNTITMLHEIIEIYKHPKMFKFLHIPLQAGNNCVLKAMNRRYTVEQWVEVVEEFRKEIPQITISTDIIVGFPTETEEQFNDTLKLVETIKPDVINISRYAQREGTIAAKMEQHSTNELKRRSKSLTELHWSNCLENLKRWIGWQGSILIDEKGSNDSWIGRNYCYKPVIVSGNFKLGDVVEVEIQETTRFDLRGDICQK